MKEDEFEVDAETTRYFQPGWGQDGTTVKIVPVRAAINRYTGLSLLYNNCPRCEYDRAKVTVDHNPNWSDDIDIECHVCHTDIVDKVERKEAELEEEREANRRSDR